MHLSDARFNRRTVLLQLSALGVASAMPARLAAQAESALDAPIDLKSIERQAAHIPAGDTMLKFNPDGTQKPFAGNTVICHLPAQCAMRDAMVALHDELATSPLVHKLGLTSTTSYHMTVFPGANDQVRSPDGWPSYVPMDATIDQCNRLVGERMAGAEFHCKLPLRVSVDVAATLNYFAACTLRLVPADPGEKIKLRRLRDRIADVYGFRAKDHDQYEFHMTMSYQIARFTDREQVMYRRILRAHLRSIVAAGPMLELGEPEYCVFPDMLRFEPKTLLACT